MDNISNCPPNTSDVAVNLAAERGWHVFPCRADKRPACPHGFQDASAEASTIVRLWRDFPGPLVGVGTGEASGFDVLDLDVGKHSTADDFYNQHERWLGHVPGCNTRSGGIHLYFQHSPGLKCSVGRPVAGIDVRSTGGYVIWWPPVVDQQGFTWNIDSNVDLPPWPLPVLQKLRPAPRPRLVPPKPIQHPERFPGDITALIRLIENAPVGQRNSVLFWCACRAGEKIRDGVLTRSEAERWMSQAALGTGLPDREVWATLRSGLDRAP